MKLARTLPRFLTPLLVFALMITAAQTNSVSKKNVHKMIISKQDQGAKAYNCPTITTRGRMVTVVLHGLMVGRFKNGNARKRRFEVGTVKRAPEHNFSFNVYVEGGGCKPINCTSEGCLTADCTYADKLKKKKRWVFEVRTSAGPIPRDIRKFENTTPEEVIYEYENIANIEGDKFHKGGVDRYKKSFKPVFYFHNGIVRTHSLTVGLENRKVEGGEEGEWKSIGLMAEVVEVKVELTAGQRLVLRHEDNESEEIWSHEYSDVGYVEGRIENLPAAHAHTQDYCRMNYADYLALDSDCPCQEIDISVFLSTIFQFSATRKPEQRAARSDEDEDLTLTHFQNYYYLVFKEDRPDRFELRNPSCQCYRVTKTDSKGGKVHLMTVPPYRCGMLRIGDGGKEIDIKQ